ncbi:L-threonylcarbamoyladenylate synthase [Gemmatimonas sp.]|uniref:L-threonylcarbamoyladenylate synthase n=1 Tax=Gemmatimonas sp. TaxID=1962908 RepID=UPI003340AC87
MPSGANADQLTVPFWSPAEIEGALRSTIAHLTERRVLAYPTETVYGFGTAVDFDSVEALVRMKGRPPGKPFLLLIGSVQQVGRLDLHMPTYAADLAARFWPGPLTLVLRGGEGRVPPRLRGPEGGVAVRFTPHVGLQRLLHAYGEPITSTSANRPGVPPAMVASEIVSQWPDEIRRGLLHVLDGGRLEPSKPSTVVDCTGRRARVIRPGVLAASQLRDVVPDLLGDT